MAIEKIIECPFCEKESVKVLHQPFVSRKNMSKSRFGSGGPVFTKEKTEILSGCSECGKTQKEIVDEMNGKKKMSHEERIAMFKKRGLPLVIGGK